MTHQGGAAVHQSTFAVELSPAGRSMSAATDAIGAHCFNVSLYRSAVPRRARLSAPLQRTTGNFPLAAGPTICVSERCILPRAVLELYDNPLIGGAGYDLGRNDIGKISEFGSVKVEKYMSMERFSHVMHIGSTVAGTIREDLDAADAVDAILPAGTLSGAPKIRACEIINELEDNKRGIYGGAVGYIDFTGNLDTCIAIRLAYKKNGKVFVRSGAGIVADSVPEKEYEECINKAKAVRRALEMAQEDMDL